MKLSICIESVYQEIDFYDRIKLVADLGFNAIECWDVAGRNYDRIAQLGAVHRLEIAICCAKDAWNNRMDDERSKVFSNIRDSIKIIKGMGCSSIIVLSGDAADSACGRKDNLISNLKRAAELAEKENVTLCLEALNSIIDHKGYHLDSSRKAIEVLNSVGSKNVKLLYDIYHMQIMEGNITQNITENIDSIGHIHAAGVPWRHEIMDGELDYEYIINAICKSGYTGFFGLEYWPSYQDGKSLRESFDFLKNTCCDKYAGKYYLKVNIVNRGKRT